MQNGHHQFVSVRNLTASPSSCVSCPFLGAWDIANGRKQRTARSNSPETAGQIGLVLPSSAGFSPLPLLQCRRGEEGELGCAAEDCRRGGMTREISERDGRSIGRKCRFSFCSNAPCESRGWSSAALSACIIHCSVSSLSVFSPPSGAHSAGPVTIRCSFLFLKPPFFLKAVHA